MPLRQIAFAAIVIGAYEWRKGLWRAADMFAATDIPGTLLLLGAVVGPLSMLPLQA